MSSAAHLGTAGDLADLEQALLGRIHEACADLRRAESLDEEERAEIHSILEAMRHDAESHARLVHTLREPGHA